MSTDSLQTSSILHQTPDINISAWLWTLPGVRLARLEALDHHVIAFVFELRMTQADLQNLLIQYANGEATVDPLAFCGKQNQLRGLLKSALAKGH